MSHRGRLTVLQDPMALFQATVACGPSFQKSRARHSMLPVTVDASSSHHEIDR